METPINDAASIAAVAIVFTIFLNDLLGGRLTPIEPQVLGLSDRSGYFPRGEGLPDA